MRLLRQSEIKKFVVSTIFLLICAGAWASAEVKAKFTDSDLVTVLKGDGYSGVEITKPGKIILKVNGTAFLLNNSYGGDLQLAYFVSGVKISLSTINQWNRTKRLSRAYLDSDKDPILEADLLGDAGLTKKQITEFIKVFLLSTQKYKEFLLEFDGK